MNVKIIVGLCGLNFSSGNLGCSALAYSFKNILNKIAKSNGYKMILYVISPFKQNILKDKEDEIYYVEYHLTDIHTYRNVRNVLKKCDFVFDFTEGDSFSDLYGIKRFISSSFLKYMSLSYAANFILGPQTYGPFKKKWTSLIAKDILRKSDKVFSRDYWSSVYIKDMANIKSVNVMDVAFSLPYEENSKMRDEKICIGLNISGLLWNEGYTGRNELGLNVDYKLYCKKLIRRLINDDKYKIYLISHVFSEDSCEDDLKACMELKKIFAECEISPRFDDPMEAKSYISRMDIFIGARMHATIAAYSSNVVTIPFSYSRKFEGLFSTLDYPFCINARVETTESAIEKTILNIKNYLILQEKMKAGNTIAKKYIRDFEEEITTLLRQKQV